MELEEALESSGSYSKKEVIEKANRFRERLLQVWFNQYVSLLYKVTLQ